MGSCKMRVGLFLVSVALLACFFTACSPEDQGSRESSRRVIVSTKLYTWQQLPEKVIGEVHNHNVKHHGNFEYRNSISFDKEAAYYLNVSINNIALAELSKSNAFPPEKVLNEKPIFLYGKYKNRWIFYDKDGASIDQTDKSDGFNTISVSRYGSIDSVWIGPIPEMPRVLEISLRGDYSGDTSLYPRDTIKK